MQEIIAAESDTIIYPEILTLQAQKQMMKCICQNQAQQLCISPYCQISGLICINLKCQCRKNHYKCHNIQIDRVLESINRHQKQIPSDAKESYQTLYKVINEMMDQLSQVRRKLQLQQKYFGLTKEELAFMGMIDQWKIQKISGKIVSELQKTFQTQFNFQINSKQKIMQQFQSKKKQFSSLCGYIQKSLLKFNDKRPQLFLNDSAILKIDSEAKLLQNWVSEAFDVKKIKSKLLFRASEHDFKASQFHKHCDAVKNTLVVVKNEFDRIIGGFNCNSWNQKTRGFYKDQTGKSFIFSVTLKQKYKCLQPQYSIFCANDWGPIFGAGRAIGLKDNTDKNSSSDAAGFPGSYNIQVNGKEKYQKKQETYQLFTGNPNGCQFKLKQYQVYEITQA